MTSKRNLRRSECQGKQKHKTVAAAWAHCTSIRYKDGDPDLKPYICRVCGAYHVGHRPKKQITDYRPGANKPVDQTRKDR